jgi:two-component system, LytTR family, response regulator
MSIKAIIIDDEKMARVLLQGIIERFCPEVEILEQCIDLPSGVKAIVKHKPELVFLDIEMPGHSGLELLSFFNEKDVNFSIIFTTAYNQYAIQAFKLSAVDYLLKPIESEELINAVNRYKKNSEKPNYDVLQHNLQAETQKKIVINSIGSVKFIPLNDITYLKADGAYTEIFLKDHSSIMTSKGLKSFEQTFADSKNFVRCHKSFIVNINFVSEINKGTSFSAVVNGKHTAYISPDKINELIEICG